MARSGSRVAPNGRNPVVNPGARCFSPSGRLHGGQVYVARGQKPSEMMRRSAGARIPSIRMTSRLSPSVISPHATTPRRDEGLLPASGDIRRQPRSRSTGQSTFGEYAGTAPFLSIRSFVAALRRGVRPGCVEDGGIGRASIKSSPSYGPTGPSDVAGGDAGGHKACGPCGSAGWARSLRAHDQAEPPEPAHVMIPVKPCGHQPLQRRRSTRRLRIVHGAKRWGKGIGTVGCAAVPPAVLMF